MANLAAGRRSHFFSGNFLARLVLGMLLLDLVVLGLAALTLQHSYQQYENRAQVAVNNLALILEHDLLVHLERVDETLREAVDALAEREPRLVSPLRERLAAEISRDSSYMDAIRLADASGQVVGGVGHLPQARFSVAEMEFFRQLKAQRQADFVLDGPHRSHTSNQWMMVLARRVEHNGQFAGVLFASIRLDRFQSIFAELDLGRHGAVSLRNQSLALMARYSGNAGVSPDVGNPNISSELKQAVQANPQQGSYAALTAIDQIPRLNSYRRLGRFPLYIVVGLAVNDFMADWWFEVLKAGSLSTLFVLLSLFLCLSLVTAWKRRERMLAKLAVEEKRFRTLLESAPDAMVILTPDGYITQVNQQTEHLFAYRRSELQGMPISRLVPDFQQLPQPQQGAGRDHELWAVSKNGQEFPVSVRLAAIDEADAEAPAAADRPERAMVCAVLRDITERKRAEAQIEFLAFHDALTSLPNRRLLQDRLALSMAAADRGNHRVALLFIDLDKFKSINDALGHSVGDALLQQVAIRLRASVRESDTIGRQGGDEFLVVLPMVNSADSIVPALLKLLDNLQQPFLVDGQEITTSVSIGAALYPDDGRDVESLQKKADIAMYRAKEAGRNTYRFYDEQMNQDAEAHLKLHNGLRRALHDGEFVLYYQPQVELGAQRIIGVEALIRWQHPELGLVSPAVFIPIAEESGMIVAIGEWVIGQACRQLASWRAAGLPEVVMAVNLSAVQFKRGDLVAVVERALQESGVPASCLELELTESILIQNDGDILAILQALKQRGVRLSIDDFGTGYSSLAYLRQFNVDKLKIDRSFIANLAVNEGDAAIVKAIVQMAESLNLRTIAEGVEQAELLAVLRGYGCQEVQGYCFSRPLPAEECAAYLEAGRERVEPQEHAV